MIYIDELKQLRLYNKPFLLPTNMKDKKKGKSVMLLTPNIESSINLMKHPLLINRYYNSYYIEKDVSFYINDSNVLEQYNYSDYVHESEEGNTEMVLQEGIYKHFQPKIIFDGYSDDVDEARGYINIELVEEYNNLFRAEIQYPITVTVHRNVAQMPPTTAGAINIISYKIMDDSSDYELYCKEAVIEMIVRTINPKCYVGIVDAVSAVCSGSYDVYKDDIQNSEMQFMCRTIKSILAEPGGYSKLVSIIRKNDIGKIASKAVKYDSKNMKELLKEDAMNPIAKLKRSITYHSRKGSAHILNKVEDNIEKTVDPTQENPTYDVVDHDLAAEEYTLSDYSDYEITESYVRTRNNITYFEEAGENAQLKKLLYRQRLRNNKEVILMWDRIKAEDPNIRYTYLNYERYKGYNLFIDLSYYNRLFFENNMYKLDKGVDLYFELLSKFVKDNRLKDAGYENEAILIPIKDWDMNPETKMWMYNADINPISVLYRLMQVNIEKLKSTFGDLDFVFLTDKTYFKINFNQFGANDAQRFLYLFRTLRENAIIPAAELEDDMKQDSSKAIVNTILDDIETSQNIKISHLTGDKNIVSKKETEITAKAASDSEEDSKVAKNDGDKKELIDKIEKVADKANTVDDALEILDNDDTFKKMLLDLSSEENEGNIVNNARATRITQLNNEILDKSIQGVTVKELLQKKQEFNDKELEKTALPIDSINKEWQELSYINMANQYDPNADIVAMLTAFSKKSYPISIRNIEVLDVSTSEDFIYTYKVEMENHLGKRFTLKFDIPKFKNSQYMMLRGNRKTISSQSFLLPIIKTDEDTVQIVSNYNKIFVRRFGTTTGKSNVACDKLIKTLNKGEYSKIKITMGDNSRICSKYELPIDYIDLASIYNKVENEHAILYFNQSELRKEFADKIDYKMGLPIGIWKGKDMGIVYFNDEIKNMECPTFAHWMLNILRCDTEFEEVYKTVNESVRYTYSKASILNTEIPIIVLAAYSEGLVKVLNKAGIEYEITEKRPSKTETLDVIKFADGFLSYKINYISSLLMNGLKECTTMDYSIADINKKYMYLDFLDQFGGRIKADGIDNFYDMMIDPVTEDVLVHCKLPTDYIQLLLYGNALLADNKFIKHGNMKEGRRLRRNEIIAGYAYKCLASAYGSYTTQIKHGRDSVMSMKQSAIIDAVLLDPTAGDLSIINALNEKEAYDTVTTKGLSGMNSDRSYSLDKRSFDDSMINVLGMSTGFAGNVGISRQATIDANIETVRGYVKPSDTKEMSSINTLCMTEALTPMGTTRDDPFRSAMNFIQTSKHGMRCRHADPLLVTNGSDEALPYLVSDIFAYKAKNDGSVKELGNDYMIIEYKDGNHEFVDLAEKVEKNSSSGFFVTLKLDTDLKEGQKIKKGQLLAYDRSSFDPTIGPNDNPAYCVGTLAKCALIDNDEGFEDSAVITNALSEAMTSDIVVPKEITIPKNTNIFNVAAIGQKVEEGDTLMIMQSPFDEEDANTLLKNLVGDEEDISDLGRVKIKSKVTGIVQDIVINRTVEMEELSESLQKLCKKYESNIKSRKAIMKKYGIDQEEELPADYKLEPIGKLKGAADSVKIFFYLKYEDKMSIGDKLIYWAAQKGVVKYIIPKGKEPYTMSRPDEKIHTLVSLSASNGRMVTSIQNIGICNRLIIEASRKGKDMAGIKYDVNLL